MSRLKVLASAYSCGPGEGSEPGIGWNIVREMSRRHDVHVITRVNNCRLIEEEIRKYPDANLTVVGYDLPKYLGWFKRGTRGLQLYYYLWQRGAYRLARKLHVQNKFDVVHHVTFGRYWSPSFMYRLGIPFISGPIGGGESAPKSFWNDFDGKAKVYEWLREGARGIGELDPYVRKYIRSATTLLATTKETAARLRAIGGKEIEIFGNVALEASELHQYGEVDPPNNDATRFVSIGRMLHWKGFHLGLRAFASADLGNAEYWFVGDGPYKAELERLARELGVEKRVRFTGNIPRDQVMECIRKSVALVHPSLHDSGGWVVIESMAAGRPVLCLDLGGPATIVDQSSGFKIPADSPEQAILGLKDGLEQLTRKKSTLERLSAGAKNRAQKLFTWEFKANQLDAAYQRAAQKSPGLDV